MLRAKRSRLCRDLEQRRIVEQQAGARNRKIERGQRYFLLSLVVPSRRFRQIQNLDRERRRIIAAPRFLQRQQQAAIGRLSRTNRPSRQRNAPDRCSRGQRNFHEIALVVSNRVAGLHQFFSVGAHQHLVASLFNVRHQHGLLVIARNVHAKRSRCARLSRPRAKRHQSRRLPARHHLAKIGGVSVFQPLRFLIFDFAGAKNFHGHAARVALGIQKPQQRNVDDAVLGKPRLAANYKARAVFDRLQKRHGEFAVLHLPIGHHRAGYLVDCDFVWELDSHFARRTLHDFKIRFRVDRCRVLSETGQLSE